MKDKKFFQSKHCRLCHSRELYKIHDFEKIPVGEKYFVNKKFYKNIIQFPMTLYRCSSCYNIQISEVIEPSYLWSNYTYLSGQTKSIDNHFLEFVNNLTYKYKSIIKKDDLVLDIGSNDGSLLKHFKNNNFNVVGVDPALNIVKIANKNRIKTLHGLFDKKIAIKINENFGKAKFITAFNVFAHTNEMKNFIVNVKKLLHHEGVFIFEVQYLGDIIKNKILGTFFHEHMCHYSITSLKNFFKINKMKLIDIERVNIQKGSIIGYVSHINSSFKELSSVNSFIKYEKNKKIYHKKTLFNFFRDINKNKIKLNNLLEKNFVNKPIIGYGAARSGPTLAYNFGLRNKIKYIIDDHFMKTNKYSPLDCVKVLSSRKINKFIDLPIVILAYLHSKKIIKMHQKFISKGGTFILLHPKIKLINYKNYYSFIKK